METTRRSWHSVDPVISKHLKRICLTSYLFSRNSTEAYDFYNVTSFTGRPGQTSLRIFGKIDNYLRQKLSDFIG